MVSGAKMGCIRPEEGAHAAWALGKRKKLDHIGLKILLLEES